MLGRDPKPIFGGDLAKHKDINKTVPIIGGVGLGSEVRRVFPLLNACIIKGEPNPKQRCNTAVSFEYFELLHSGINET